MPKNNSLRYGPLAGAVTNRAKVRSLVASSERLVAEAKRSAGFGSSTVSFARREANKMNSQALDATNRTVVNREAGLRISEADRALSVSDAARITAGLPESGLGIHLRTRERGKGSRDK